MKRNVRFCIGAILAVILSACSAAHPNSAVPIHSLTTDVHTPDIAPTQTTAVVFEGTSWTIGPTSIGKGAIKNGEFSPDGKRFAAITSLGVYIYAVDTLQVLDFISANPPVVSAAFSPDWLSLATARGSAVTVSRLADKQTLASLDTEQGLVYHLLFSPDGSLLATFVKPPGDEIYSFIVELWSVREAKRLGSWEISIYDDTFFAPDGKIFYAWNVSQMAGVRRWEIPSGTPLSAWTNLNPYPLAFAPDGKTYAATTNDAILVQRTADGTQLLKLTHNPSTSTNLIRFSPDASRLLAWFMDGTLKIWRTADGSLLNTIEAGPPAVRFFAISPDDQTLAFPEMDGIAFYNLADGSLLRRLDDHLSAIQQAVVSPDGARVAVLVEGGGLMVWDLASIHQLYSRPDINAIALAWSPDGKWLVSGGWDDNLHFLRAADGGLGLSIPAHTEQIQSVAFSPNGDLLASSSMESVKVRQISDGSLQRGSPGSSTGRSYSVPGGWVSKVRYSPDGRYLAATSAEGKVVVWRVDNGRPVAEYSVPNLAGDRDSIDFSPDGNILAIGETSQIGLWRIMDAKPFLSLPVGNEKVTTVRISSDGKLLVCGLTDGSLLLWQIPDGKLLQTLRGGTEGIASLDFSADGRILLSASRDGTIRTWNIDQ